MQTDAMLVPQWTKNVQSMSSPARGIYCLQAAPGIDPEHTLTVVSPERAYSVQGPALFAYTFIARDRCPKDRFEVRTYIQTSPFTVPALSDQVAFTFVIP